MAAGSVSVAQGGNVVTMATGQQQQIRPAMAAQGTPVSGVVTNGVAVGGIVTSSNQGGQQGPIMVQGPNGMRPNGPQQGGPIVSNPNINLVNAFGNNGPQTVKMTTGGTVVSNGPVMTLPDGSMGNGMVPRPQGPNMIAQRVMVGQQQPGLIRGMVRGPMMTHGQFRPGMPGQMVQQGPTIVGMPNQRQPIMQMQVRPGPGGNVAMVSNHQPFNVNTTNVNTMQMTPNGPLRPQIPQNGPQVNMPPQYPNPIESGKQQQFTTLKSIKQIRILTGKD